MFTSFCVEVLISLFLNSILFDDGNVVTAQRYIIGNDQNSLHRHFESGRTLKTGKLLFRGPSIVKSDVPNRSPLSVLVKKNAQRKGKKYKSNNHLSKFECFAALQTSGFNLSAFEKYDDFFADNSVMTLAQAGQYRGANAIKECVAYASPMSPYVSTYDIVRTDMSFREYDKKRDICSFRNVMTIDYSIDQVVTCTSTEYTLSVMLGIEFNPRKGVVEIINVYYDEPYLAFHFMDLASTDCTRQFVCDVMSSDFCSNPVENCVEKLASLPITDQAYFDGNSQGCRFLHAVLAQYDYKHCAHLAFEPTLDRDGEIWCQELLGIKANDLFEKIDFDAFRDFQDSVGIFPGVGYALKV